MNRLRVVHLLPDTDDAGAENQARYLIAGMRDRDAVEPELVYFGRGRGHRAFEELGVPLRELPRRRRLALDVFRRARALRRLYADRPPDVLHTWLLEGNIVGLLAARAWPGTRVVITQQGGAYELTYRNHLRVQRLLIGRADLALSNSEQGAEILAGHMPPERVRVIANGVPAERFTGLRPRDQVRAELGIDADTPLVVTVGRAQSADAVRQKGYHVLLESFERMRRELPGVVLALVGPTEEELRRHGLRPGPGVRALGWLEEPVQVVAAADAFVLASFGEGHSNAACEALAVGIPVVTTRSGLQAPMAEQMHGRVVPIGDPEALAAAVLEVLADPPDGDVIRALAQAQLSMESKVDATLAAYRDSP